jgi:hypothetical protein
LLQPKHPLVKIEQLIVQHLYNNKSVTLQGIGTIHLDPSVSIPQEGDKNITVPENAFSFEYNLRAGEDEKLIDFIVQQTRKIKPLASSDLESYSILAKQFLNIGKPLTIEGIGTILKNQSGAYDFIPGNFVSPKMEDAPKQLKEKTEENISFENEAPKKGNNRGLILFIFFILFASLTGLGLYYFIFKNKAPKTEPVAEEQTILQPDTTTKITDTTLTTADTTALKLVEPVMKDSFNFKVVIREYTNEAAASKALTRFGSFGYKQLTIIKVDSTKYRLAMPFTAPLTDTLKVRDSLKRIFLGKPYIITQ